jgi:CMP-N-acetylneuraminic acid synthetase
MNRVAVILARAGSKRLPGKNKLLLCGKPLIEYSIISAIESGLFAEIVVSTDDRDIKEFCKTNYKNNVTVVDRPVHLAGSETRSEDSMIHALEMIGVNKYKWVMLLQPTSPLRDVHDIKVAVCLGEAKDTTLHSRCEDKVNGAIYYIKTKDLIETRKIDCEGYYIEMPKARSVDIDTLEDFEEAIRIMGE